MIVVSKADKGSLTSRELASPDDDDDDVESVVAALDDVLGLGG